MLVFAGNIAHTADHDTGTADLHTADCPIVRDVLFRFLFRALLKPLQLTVFPRPSIVAYVEVGPAAGTFPQAPAAVGIKCALKQLTALLGHLVTLAGAFNASSNLSLALVYMLRL